MVQAHPAVMSGEHHVRFFQRKFVQTFLPFVTSLVFHVGLVVIALSVVKVVTIATTPRVEVQTQAVSIDMPTDPKGDDISKTLLFPGIGEDGTRRQAQEIDPNDVDEKSTIFRRGTGELPNLNPGGGGDDEQAMIGLSIGGVGKNGKTGTGVGPDFGDGIGPAPKGRLGHFGPQHDGGPFVAPPRGARSIVYVCDATGSMTPQFSSLRRELGIAIDRLDALQFFNVIFFSDNQTLSLSPALTKADVAGKTKATAFCNDVTSRGLTNPIPAIRQAFAQKPDLIYVLTDGFDQVNDLESVVKEFDALNKDRKVKVNTILIGTTEQKDLVDVLQRIAKEHGGTMKIVSKDEF